MPATASFTHVGRGENTGKEGLALNGWGFDVTFTLGEFRLIIISGQVPKPGIKGGGWCL